MYIYPDKLLDYLTAQGWDANRFAEELDVPPQEVEKMLSGKRIEVDVARKFINYFKAELAAEMIDFGKTGVKNPFA